MLTNLEARARQLGPMLDRLKPDDWIRNGAPQAYAAQVTGARDEVNYLVGSAQKLAADPENMPAALDTLFRMQALNSTLGSALEGMRKYGNPAIADLVQAMADENDHNRDRLKQYVIDLATDKEHELKVMDAEAQRCRAAISNQRPSTQHSTTRQK